MSTSKLPDRDHRLNWHLFLPTMQVKTWQWSIETFEIREIWIRGYNKGFANYLLPGPVEDPRYDEDRRKALSLK